MSKNAQQCPYCPQWVQGDLWMTVHLEQAHSDLMPLFSGPDRRPSKQSKQVTIMNTDCPICGDRGWGGTSCNTCIEPEVAQVAALIYEHRWYGLPGHDRGRCSCHWDDPDSPGEITYREHTRHVAYEIVHADTGTGQGER